MTYSQVCSRCLMDNSATDIVFDHHGVCNFCNNFMLGLHNPTQVSSYIQLEKLIQRIKKQGRGREYDCIVGLSGGVDSAYVLFQAVKNGLRPLAVHLDNGWNSELAVDNIANLVRSLNVDLYTHVINWEENRDMQLSFFKANVIDIELLMDNAMLALNYEQARKYGLNYILAGTNHATEGIRMPVGWNWLKFDKHNILAIQRRFGSLPVKTHPLISVLDFARFEFIHGIHWTPFLDFFHYQKEKALDELKKEVGFRSYPYKHYESIFTRFYQGYILPRKFGIDKRRLHLSALVLTGQMSRDDAINLLQESPYPDQDQMNQDREFVMKKLGFNKKMFEDYLSAPPVDHAFYGTERHLWESLKQLHKFLGLRRGK